MHQDGEDDPWHYGHDPWQGNYMGGEAEYNDGEESADFVVHPEEAPQSSVEPPPQRIIHDIPPVWDGKDPENQTEPYLKLLAGWLATTRTQKTQQGMTILHYASGDLKLIIDELTMVSARFLADIDLRLRATMKAIGTMKHDSTMHERPFGGLNVIFAGDFWQLDPPEPGGVSLSCIPK